MEMKKEAEFKIKISDQRVVTLEELYAEYEKTHRSQASLPFEEKIRALVERQKIAIAWENSRSVVG